MIRVPGGETLAGGDTRSTFAPDGEVRPTRVVETVLRRVGEPSVLDVGIERRVSESRRLWP